MAGPPRLVLLPYRVAARPLETVVQAPGAGAVTNRAFALFDLGMELTWQSGGAAGRVEGSQGRGGLVGTEGQGGISGSEAVASRSGQGTQGGLAGSAGEASRVGQETAAGRTGSEASGARTGQESAATGTGTEAALAIQGTRTAGEVAGAGGSRSWLGRGGERSFASPQQYEDFLSQQANVLRARSGSLAELITQDRLLRQIFALGAAEFREQIRSQTRERPELLQLSKSASVPVIVPGETFDYVLELRNASAAAVQRTILYDEFPRQLQFEGRYRVELLDAQGKPREQAGEGEEVLSFLTPNEWEAGKIAWNLPARFAIGRDEVLRLSFQATWYRERGLPREAGCPVRAAADATSPALGSTGPADLLLVAERAADFLKVSLRPPAGAAPVLGWIRAADFRPEADADATDFERRLRSSIYFDAGAKGSDR